MKKYIIYGIFTISSLALAIDLDTNNIMIESGMKGFEIESNYITEQLSDKKSKQTPLFEKYALINANNRLLSKELTDDNLDRENLYKVSLNRLNINKNKINEASLLYGTLLDENERIGISLNLADYTNMYNDTKIKGKLYQMNLFYSNKNYENGNEILGTTYIGYSKDKKNETFSNSKFIGFYGKYTKNIEIDYDLFTPKYYFEGDLKRFQIKEKSLDKNNKNNDSINIGTGFILEKDIIYDEFLLKIAPFIGYNRELLDKRIYKSIEGNDEFKDQGKIGIEVKGKYTETFEIFTKLEVKKSFNTSNYNTLGTVGFKINI